MCSPSWLQTSVVDRLGVLFPRDERVTPALSPLLLPEKRALIWKLVLSMVLWFPQHQDALTLSVVRRQIAPHTRVSVHVP